MALWEELSVVGGHQDEDEPIVEYSYQSPINLAEIKQDEFTNHLLAGQN